MSPLSSSYIQPFTSSYTYPWRFPFFFNRLSSLTCNRLYQAQGDSERAVRCFDTLMRLRCLDRGGSSGDEYSNDRGGSSGDEYSNEKMRTQAVQLFEQRFGVLACENSAFSSASAGAARVNVKSVKACWVYTRLAWLHTLRTHAQTHMRHAPGSRAVLPSEMKQGREREGA